MTRKTRRERRTVAPVGDDARQLDLVSVEPLVRPKVPYAAARCARCSCTFAVYSIFDSCPFCRSWDWQIVEP